MKTITRSVIAPNKDSEIDKNKILFSPSEVADLLLQIYEFRDYNIRLTEIYSGVLQLIVGDSIYQIAEENVSR